METLPDVYPLKSLQIGDIQSYLSQIFLYFAPVSSKLFILVDNRPWLMNKHPRSTKLWQLMVTKYRISPFTNTRTQQMNQNSGSSNVKNGHNKSSTAKQKRLARWFSVIDASKWQEKSLFPLMDLSKALHGFIVFEVEWKDVRGINYLNELQSDTSVALEVKTMKKWDFNSIEQSLSCISSWFLGTVSETQSLWYNLKLLSDMDAPADCFQYHFPLPKEQLSDSTSQSESPPISIFFNAQECSSDDQQSCIMDHPQHDCPNGNKEPYGVSVSTPSHSEQMKSVKCMDFSKESNIHSAQYMDTLLLFRFSDRNLPFKLRQIITSDLRLLALLESGLPSWVIFLQSYPIFCQFYLPWMRPLASTLYILISLVTVIIGFYDLYKNVPLLKATAASLCGPLFDWIEAWEMVSRLRYLGTMLFLQNFEKSVRWFLMVVRMVKPAILLITKPLMEPIMEVVELVSPIWSMFAGTGKLFFSTGWNIFGSSYSTIFYLVRTLLSPFGLLYFYVLTVVTSVSPIFYSIWELLLIPVHFSFVLVNYVVSLFSNIYYLFKDVWQTSSGVMRLTVEANSGAHEISKWQSLWKDLFSQVFRAIRSIINVFIAFITSCNRHRLSIYNHVLAFIRRLYRLLRLVPYPCSCWQSQRIGHHDHPVECQECDRCK